MSAVAKFLTKPSFDWLLVCVPIAAYLEYRQPESHTAIFIFSCLSIIPLAGWMGHATEHLAEKTGEGVGGLLNATFGNAAELIIALMALRADKAEIVKASLTGSIIGNVLLVLGAACLAGGLKHKELSFNPRGARMMSTMLTLATISLVAPMAFHYLAGAEYLKQEIGHQHEMDLSLQISVLLLITYGLSLLFSLHTHKKLFQAEAAEAAGVTDEDEEHAGHQPWSVKKSLIVLLIATGLVAWVSEFLVGSVEKAAEAFHMNHVFVGVIVVAIIGNAAEHSTALLVAMKNRMDLALGIAIGSSIQIALFVAPVLVIASYWICPHPMDLLFSPAEVLAIGVSVIIVDQIVSDGESNWLEGVQLLSVYIILAMVFYFLPGH